MWWMEAFDINPQGIELIRESEPQSEAEARFKLFVLGPEEWDQVPLLWPDHLEQQADWIEHIREIDAVEVRAIVKEGALGYHPRFERLSQDVHFMCFRDIDEQRHERPVRFFLSSNVFVLLGWNGFNQELLSEWAGRGILTNPLELACALGLRVLRHHQKRLEIIEDQMDVIEEEILTATHARQLNRIISLHRQILGLKRSLNAHQSVFGRLKNIEKPEYGDLQEELIFEIQRVSNNAHQTHEMIESLREAYQAAIDNRANDIMKVLTLVATIILPVALLTGFFGMNFEIMPFIHQPYGIFVFYGLSSLIFLVVMTFFWKNKWLQ
jgi:magnesium transporter